MKSDLAEEAKQTNLRQDVSRTTKCCKQSLWTLTGGFLYIYASKYTLWITTHPAESLTLHVSRQSGTEPAKCVFGLHH